MFDDPLPEPGDEAPRVLSVGELTRRIQVLLGGIGRVAVEGEVTGLKRASSGHVYFSLKDRARGVESVLSCVIWRSRLNAGMQRVLREGARLVAHGAIDVYSPRGSYSLHVERLEERGVGALLAELEERKRALRERGWFDRHRPLPALPRVVGVATSRDGAAFRDFLRTRSLRWPLYPVRLAHTPVQGPGAAAAIAEAIARLDASGVDVVVVCRGGGALEDLWGFNELAVAEAIRACSVPVVSGVGHESDTTLADLVADVRAHTPTDAAQRAIPDRRELVERLERAGGWLLDAVDRQLERRAERLERLALARTLRSPEWILGERQAELGRLAQRLAAAAALAGERRTARLGLQSARLAAHAPRARLERAAERVAALARRLVAPPAHALERREARLEALRRGLEATSPFRVLERGYSITRRRGERRPLTSGAELAPGDELETLLASDALVSRLERVEPREDGA